MVQSDGEDDGGQNESEEDKPKKAPPKQYPQLDDEALGVLI